ncbi:uncharacterized protein LOC101241636 isoform X2 [Hydra vulgaris]|uniref:uncharacterized protein LOC101241636 isoform X2 n=1 Tax=Hydra vulgaris TaxID=6087 RepID=UPI0032EA8A88
MNTTYVRSIKTTPYEIVFGQKPNGQFPLEGKVVNEGDVANIIKNPNKDVADGRTTDTPECSRTYKSIAKAKCDGGSNTAECSGTSSDIEVITLSLTEKTVVLLTFRTTMSLKKILKIG